MPLTLGGGLHTTPADTDALAHGPEFFFGASRRDVRGDRSPAAKPTHTSNAPHTGGREKSSRPARPRPPRRQDIVDSIMAAAYNTVPEEEPLCMPTGQLTVERLYVKNLVVAGLGKDALGKDVQQIDRLFSISA